MELKKISLNKASKLYDEIKLHKRLDYYVCIFIHDNTVKVGYNNRFGVSGFIKNNEPRFLVMNEDKTEELLQDYYKKDAIKILLDWINEAIEEYNTKIKNSITWRMRY